MAGEHPCAAPGCDRQIPSEHLMCVPHWKALPPDIQREVNSTWRHVRREPEAYRVAREKAVQWHRDHPDQRGGLLL